MPTESVSFPWYPLSCQQHNWPIARWHLEYLGKLSTCNCEDLELICYFWLWWLSPEIAISGHLWLKEISERWNIFFHPQGNQRTFNFSFSRVSHLPLFFSSIFFLNLGGCCGDNTYLLELLWRLKKTSALLKFYAYSSICLLSRSFMFSWIFYPCSSSSFMK